MRTTLGLLALLGLVCQPALGRDWQAVRTFAYQLQRCDFAQLRQSDFDLLVMDYSRDGHADNRYQSDEIASLRSDRPRLVLAYLSIGEAEEYRFYWKPDFRPGNPAWLLPPNPNWPDNYKVRYWDPEWTAEVEQRLDRAVAAGKLVLNVDYTGRVDQARQATRRAHARGYREFIAVRELDQIQVALNPVPETNLVGPIALGLLLLVLVGWLVRWRLRRR